MCDPMISFSSTPFQPGDYPLGNSSHPAMNMHLGMSLLETDNDGGFMVSQGQGGGGVSEGFWQRKEQYGKGHWSMWRGQGQEV